MYEFFEHTADLGLRVQAPDIGTLFQEAAEALFATILEDVQTVRETHRHDIHVKGEDRELLLFDWLKELLYLFDSQQWVFHRFVVHVTAAGLTGSAWGEPLDRARHELSHEVKAITYHGLRVESTSVGWLAEIIVDI